MLTATPRHGHPIQGMPTPRQMAYIATLCAERNLPVQAPRTSREASEMIAGLLNTPRPRAQRADAPLGVTEPGMYRDAEGCIYKVQRSKGDPSRLYAKKLTPIGGTRLTETDARVQWEFHYAPGAVRSLTPAMKLTLEQAKEFGIRYGVCCVCGAFLRDATSVAEGIGPVCAGRVR